MLSTIHCFIRKSLIKTVESISRKIILTTCLALLSIPAFASAENIPSDTPEISIRSSIISSRLLEAAWLLMPEQALLTQLKQSNKNQSSLWLWDKPSVNLSYQAQNDSKSEFDSGLPAEWQLDLELPIVGPGLWRTQASMKQAQIKLINAEQRMLRWRLSGELEQLIWTIQLRKTQVEQTNKKHQLSLDQINWLSKLESLGERPKSEVLQAR